MADKKDPLELFKQSGMFTESEIQAMVNRKMFGGDPENAEVSPDILNGMNAFLDLLNNSDQNREILDALGSYMQAKRANSDSDQ